MTTREILSETVHSVTPALVAEMLVVIFAIGIGAFWCLHGAGRI